VVAGLGRGDSYRTDLPAGIWFAIAVLAIILEGTAAAARQYYVGI